MKSRDILEKLIGFPSISSESNLDLMRFVASVLEEHGVSSHLIYSDDGCKANLHAVTGPLDRPGIILSGHTDVVPVEGQIWSSDPFVMSERDGRLYGRGTADMKGFVACALSACIQAAHMQLEAPLHLALSYDEEVGCRGVGGLIEYLRHLPCKPLMCIVGEPTGMRVATGHKGKIAARATCTGREGHSAMAPHFLNALHLACDFVGAIRQEQAQLEAEGVRDNAYEVPYTTIHVGKIQGGVALNIVPNLCEVDFEIRNISGEDMGDIVGRLRSKASGIASVAKGAFPEADIKIEIVNAYPGLDTAASSQAVNFVKSLTGANGTTKVAFGTEAGLFDRDAGIPTVVCGPGFMDHGHKPDEFIAIDQLDQCDEMLGKVIEKLRQGVVFEGLCAQV